MAKKILITGGLGFVGKSLTKLLVSQGYHISILSRSSNRNTSAISYYKWNVEKGEVSKKPIIEADYIIHLAGENISKSRWTKKRKQEIIDSRVDSTELLYSVLASNKNNLKAFIAASAIGIYGTKTTNEVFSEESENGTDFLASVCEKWESAVDQISNLGIRTVKLRTGVVFGKNGGALQKMTSPIKMGFGSAIGTGEQIIPWIHIEDLCFMYLQAINNKEIKEVFNAVVGDKLTNKNLSKMIASKLNKPFFMPNIPAFMLKMIFGEMSDILLKGSQVSSEKIKKTSFIFKHKTIESALDDLLQLS